MGTNKEDTLSVSSETTSFRRRHVEYVAFVPIRHQDEEIPSMISLRDVTKRYGTHDAVSRVTLSVDAGETCALIGPSGCGKSTLIRLMNGLITPTSGSASVDGSDPVGARIKMGYVIQEGGLFPHLTAGKNVSLMAGHLGRKVDLPHLAEIAKLPVNLLDQYPSELSGGQRQRVSLMRALALDPPILLLDEPLGALDPMIRAELQRDLRQLFRSMNKTVVLVTHDLAEAAYLSQRIILMRAGQVLQDGSLSELQNRPSDPFVSEFIAVQRSLQEMSA
jgi:osmoprotectant transport system ATP-binding protein